MTETYTEKFTQIVDEIVTELKRGKSGDTGMHHYWYDGIRYDILRREHRIALIRAVSEDYVKAHAEHTEIVLDNWRASGGKSERPATQPLDSALLERLADAVLDEELTDQRRSKAHEEYPILSERQLDRRYEHEYSIDLADSYDTDGKNRAKPYRRPRTNSENRFIDRESRRKNRRRNAQYKKDSANGPVVSYNLYDTGGELAESFVSAESMGKLWADKLCDGTAEIVESVA